jgi:hypothetical protein
LEQAQLVAESKLDLAAFVIQEDAEFLRTVIRQHGLDIVSPQDLQGLIARYPWLGKLCIGLLNTQCEEVPMNRAQLRFISVESV